jgi:hypothetical protein
MTPGAHRQRVDGLDDQRIARGEVIAVPGQEANTGSVSARQQAESVVLDLVNHPALDGADKASEGRQGSMKPGGRTRNMVLTRFQRHTVRLVPATLVVLVQVVVFGL